MSRFISALLAKEKNSLRSTLDKLEMASGENSIDAKLISEIVVNSKAKIRQLGLDPEDTIAYELHVSLVNLAELHDGFLLKALGESENSAIADIIASITKFADKVAKTRTVWAIKHAEAKRQLKNLPPKNLMKTLGYRSMGSMIKRENIDDLMAGLRIVESKEYLAKFYRSLKSLNPGDFESRPMSVRKLSQKKWRKPGLDYARSHKDNTIELKEMGSLIVLPLPEAKLKGITIMLLPLILYKLNEIHTYSSFFKFEQVRHNFGEIFSKTLQGQSVYNANMAGLDLSWAVIRDHFGKLAQTGNTDIFEPHIQADDLENKAVEESLYKLEPALHFWFGDEALGLPYDNGVISFNLMDVATSLVNNLSFGSNCTKYLADALWRELLKRYLGEEPLHDQVLQQLDNQQPSDEFGEQGIQGTAFA